jgi:hypothetical protein
MVVMEGVVLVSHDETLNCKQEKKDFDGET